MKILQVVPVFSPMYGGGSPVVSYHLSRGLAKKGHEVTIFTSDYKFSHEWAKSMRHVKVYSFKTRLGGSARVKLYITPSMVEKAIEKIKYFDVIHIHTNRAFQNVVVHHYAKKYRVPYVLQAHGNTPHMDKKQRKWFYDVFFGHRMLKDASRIIALNQSEAQQYKSMGIPTEKIRIIPNGIDLSEYRNLPPKGSFMAKYGIEKSKKIILYLGRIHWIKNLDLLAEAFAYLVKNEELSNVLLVIAGPDEDFLQRLKSTIKLLKIEDNVLFTGPLCGREKLEAYVDADIFVLPSRYEIFPMTVLEVYACRKPVVASKVGGLKNLVVNNETGILVEPGNMMRLAQSINSLLNDNEKRGKMGLKAWRFVEENFSIEGIVDRLEGLYEEVRSQLFSYGLVRMSK